MKTRITFTAWGNGLDKIYVPSWATGDDCDYGVEAVVKAFERKNGLSCCAGPRDEGSVMERGVCVARHYAFTLGQHLRSGGYSPRAEVWISIPVITPHG